MSYYRKLGNLQDRRSLPEDIRKKYVLDSAYDSINESYLALNESDVVKYAVGIMQAVPKRYTEISFKEGERVASSLKSGLRNEIDNITHEFQGSVPLDIHIKGASDVDVLVFHPYLIAQKPWEYAAAYTSVNDGLTMIDRIRQLRCSSERVLINNFPAASIDITKAKAINLKGGSLQREIDIVPAHWYDTIEYQRHGHKEDREVRIYDKSTNKTISNSPFKHMKRIRDRDAVYNGNLNRVCRMLKNLKEDSTEIRYKILDKISSYDIASLVYCMDSDLTCPEYFELGLVSKTRDYLIDISSNDCEKGCEMMTPDGSRRVIDSAGKKDALIVLAVEVNDLLKSITNSLGIFSNEVMAINRLSSKAIRL
jgi:hypothetical protein